MREPAWGVRWCKGTQEEGGRSPGLRESPTDVSNPAKAFLTSDGSYGGPGSDVPSRENWWGHLAMDSLQLQHLQAPRLCSSADHSLPREFLDSDQAWSPLPVGGFSMGTLMCCWASRAFSEMGDLRLFCPTLSSLLHRCQVCTVVSGFPCLLLLLSLPFPGCPNKSLALLTLSWCLLLGGSS